MSFLLVNSSLILVYLQTIEIPETNKAQFHKTPFKETNACTGLSYRKVIKLIARMTPMQLHYKIITNIEDDFSIAGR